MLVSPWLGAGHLAHLVIGPGPAHGDDGDQGAGGDQRQGQGEAHALDAHLHIKGGNNLSRHTIF